MKPLLIKVVVSCALLGAFLWRTPLDEVWLHLRHLDIASLAAATALSFAAWWLSAVRLWSLLPGFSLGKLVRATFSALFYSTVLPGQIAGDVIKAYRLGRQSDRAGHAEAATLIDRGMAIFAMMVIGAVAAFVAPVIPISLRIFFFASVAVIGLAGILTASTPFRHWLLERYFPPGSGRVRNFIRHFGIALHECLRKPSRMASNFALAIAFHVLCIAIQIVLGRALNIALPWSTWTVVYAGVTLVVLLPLSIAGIGLRESGYVGMLALFGASASVALSLSFTIFALALIGAAAGGIVELVAADGHKPLAASEPSGKDAETNPPSL
ncbi:MAG: lysylphosphatidylglycerol synthase transmembrane domain-containing protein [Dokdonella sp.]